MQASPAKKISLPRPCEEAWGNMQPSENGRFCAVCTTEVVDFTEMQEAEIIAFLEQHKDRKICGRFDTAQVQTPEEWQFGGILRAFRWTLTMAGFLLFAAAAQAQNAKLASKETEKADSVYVQFLDKMSYRTIGELPTVKVYVKGKLVTQTETNRQRGIYIAHEHFAAGKGWVKIVMPRNSVYKKGVFHLHKDENLEAGEAELYLKRRNRSGSSFRRRVVVGTPTF